MTTSDLAAILGGYPPNLIVDHDILVDGKLHECAYSHIETGVNRKGEKVFRFHTEVDTDNKHQLAVKVKDIVSKTLKLEFAQEKAVFAALMEAL